MDKGYYYYAPRQTTQELFWSQSTIKMDKGYYQEVFDFEAGDLVVAIHNKNGQGLLHNSNYYSAAAEISVAIHNKNGQGLLLSGK